MKYLLAPVVVVAAILAVPFILLARYCPQRFWP